MKKLLLKSSIVIAIIFIIMLITSYAYYLFEEGSTTFDTSTYDANISVSYNVDEYINITNAIPISEDKIDTEASYNKFTITVLSDFNSTESLISISLVNIQIDDELKNSDFRYQLLQDGEIISSGTALDFTNTTFEISSKIALEKEGSDFIFRVWINDNGENQNDMIGKTMSASIEVNAVKVRTTSNYCLDNGFTKLSDCILVTENSSPTVNDAKTYIESKGDATTSQIAPTVTYQESQEEVSSSSVYSSTNNFTLSKSYTFDQSTGVFTLTDYSRSTLTDDYIGYYTCGGSSTSWYNCAKLYQILSYTTTTSNNITTYKITNAIVYTPKSTISKNSEKGLYKTSDDYGTTYFFRGNVKNNYVSFAGFIWRIIRINGDGSIRMIYSGTSTTDTGSDTSIGTVAYNTNAYDPTYVGYKYSENFTLQTTSSTSNYTGISTNINYYYADSYTFDETTNKFSLTGNTTSGIWSENYSNIIENYPYTCLKTTSDSTCDYILKLTKYVNEYTATSYYISYSSSSYEGTLNNTEDSNIKAKIDTWYENNIKDKTDTQGNLYSTYLSDEIFCNDRSVYSGSGYLLAPTTNYNAYNRLVTNKTPSLICNQEEDQFSVSNGNLTYPIALITADEISLAGGVYNLVNTEFYLYTGQSLYTMTPARLYSLGIVARIFYTNSLGLFSNGPATNTLGIRPVINLSSNVLISEGNGSASAPYQVYLN